MTDIEIPEGFTRWDRPPFREKVEVIYRCGERDIDSASEFEWSLSGSSYDIIAYRIVSQ